MSRPSRHLSFDLIRFYVRGQPPAGGKCAFHGTVLIQSKVGQVRRVLLCFSTDQQDTFEVAIDQVGSDSIIHEFDVSFAGSRFGLSHYELEADGKLIRRSLEKPDMIRTPNARLVRPRPILS
jgi:hypothetical protein